MVPGHSAGQLMAPRGMAGSAHSARATARAPAGPMAANLLGSAVCACGTRGPGMRTICRRVTEAVSWHSVAITEPALVPVPDADGEPEAPAGAAPAVPAAGAGTLPHAASRSEPSTTGPS